MLHQSFFLTGFRDLEGAKLDLSARGDTELEASLGGDKLNLGGILRKDPLYLSRSKPECRVFYSKILKVSLQRGHFAGHSPPSFSLPKLRNYFQSPLFYRELNDVASA